MPEINSREAGRPRDKQSHQKILRTAIQLVKRDGYNNVTIKSIAAEAKVGRQTIYRWWNTKADIMLEAILETLRSDPIDTSSVEAFFIGTFILARGTIGEIVVGLMADAQGDPDLLAQVKTQLIDQRRLVLMRILDYQAKQANSVYTAPVDTIVDMLFGAMWYRLLDHHAAVDAKLAAQLAYASQALLIADNKRTDVRN